MSKVWRLAGDMDDIVPYGPGDDSGYDLGMPTEYRPTVTDNTTINGNTPMAAVHICEGCGYENAPFGQMVGGEMRSYCGWVNGAPVCVGKGKAGKAA